LAGVAVGTAGLAVGTAGLALSAASGLGALALSPAGLLPLLAAGSAGLGAKARMPEQEQANMSVPDLKKYTPDFVEEHRDELGIPPGAPIEDFFTEFIAHQVTGGEGRRSDHCAEMDQLHMADELGMPLNEDQQRDLDLWKEEKAMIEAWGYDPIITKEQEVIDNETGLYALRYNATDEGRAAGRGDIASFRGTQPGEEQTGSWTHDMFCDLWSDTRRTVGENQFRNNEGAIGDLIGNGRNADGNRGVSTVTGHSLGGYLSQHAGASFTDRIDNVVTFQAGGISEEEIAKFNENNADGSTNVRHHYTGNTDFVHMAGEERLGGQFFDYSSNNWDFGHLKGLMFGASEEEAGVLQKLGGISHVTESDTDTVNSGMRHIAEAGRSIGGMVGDITGAPAWALSELAEGRIESNQHLSENIQGIKNVASQGAHETWADAVQATQETSHALAEGDLFGALGAGLSGMGQVASDVFNTNVALTGGVLNTGFDRVWDEGSAMVDGAAVGLETLGIGVQQGYNGAEELTELAFESHPRLGKTGST